MSLQDQIRDCEEKEQLLDQSLEALDRLQKSLSTLQQKLVEAAEELAAARRQLPKPKMMKVRVEQGIRGGRMQGKASKRRWREEGVWKEGAWV